MKYKKETDVCGVVDQEDISGNLDFADFVLES